MRPQTTAHICSTHPQSLLKHRNVEPSYPTQDHYIVILADVLDDEQASEYSCDNCDSSKDSEGNCQREHLGSSIAGRCHDREWRK